MFVCVTLNSAERLSLCVVIFTLASVISIITMIIILDFNSRLAFTGRRQQYRKLTWEIPSEISVHQFY